MRNGKGYDVETTGYNVSLACKTIKPGNLLGFDPLNCAYLFLLDEKALHPIKMQGDTVRICDTLYGLCKYLARSEIQLGSALVCRYKQICKHVQYRRLCNEFDSDFISSLDYQASRLRETIFGNSHCIDFEIYFGASPALSVRVHPRV